MKNPIIEQIKNKLVIVTISAKIPVRIFPIGLIIRRVL